MARYVVVEGESAYRHVLDLDLNPWAEDQIAQKKLTVVEELDELPPDPWAPKRPSRGKVKEAEPHADAVDTESEAVPAEGEDQPEA